MMFIERVKEKYALNEPIFTEDLLRLFSDYSRVQTFRLIDKGKERGEIVQYAKGVYFVPQKTRIGFSTITADDVVLKRYLSDGDEIYGIYSGIKLLNAFSVTTQMAGVVEIVTNNESAKYREIQINNRRFILRKSRCRIDKDNAAAYTLMQLFSEIGKEDRLDEIAVRKIQNYIAKENVAGKQLFEIARFFPARAAKMMIGSGIIDGTV